MGSGNRVGSPESESRPAATTMEALAADRGCAEDAVLVDWTGGHCLLVCDAAPPSMPAHGWFFHAMIRDEERTRCLQMPHSIFLNLKPQTLDFPAWAHSAS